MFSICFIFLTELFLKRKNIYFLTLYSVRPIDSSVSVKFRFRRQTYRKRNETETAFGSFRVVSKFFSAAGQIYLDRRSNLRGENVDELILFLKYYIRLFNYEY